MKDNLSRKDRVKDKFGDKSAASDVSQFQYMTRDELKQMVLLEKAKKEAQAAGKNPESKMPVSSQAGPSLMGTSPGAMAYRRSTSLLAPEAPPPEPEPVPSVSEPAANEMPAVIKPPVMPSGSPKTDLLVRLAMAEVKEIKSEDDEDKPPKPPKNPYNDRIERSILSNEPLENWKGKSRKI
jgi:hypothetical protein